MKLVIAEKPSVARSIASVIGATQKKNGYIEGNDYIVSWCLGHLAGFEEPSGKWEMNELPILPTDNLVVKENTSDQFKVVKSLMDRSDVTSLVCATDAGREGEAIFRYTYYAAKCNKPFERLWISSMTDSAIKDGFSNLQDGSNFDNLYQAAVARDKADSLVGISGTRLFSLVYGQYKPPLSVGRVQTPTLSMIVQRELDIKNFIKERYYKVHIACDVDGKTLEAETKALSVEAQAKGYRDACENGTVTVTSIEEEIKKKSSPKLYDLTSLQRDCNRLFGYTAQQTLDMIQELYESKLCTYPRTDSKYLTDDMLDMVSRLIDITSQSIPLDFSGLVPDKEIKKCINNSKVSDHHAILPTEEIESLDWNTLSAEKVNVLSIICLRLLTATAKPNVYKATKVILEHPDAADSDIFFEATGKVVLDQGYKTFEEIYKNSRKIEKGDVEEPEDKELPNVSQGDVLNVTNANVTEHWTQPPKHYNEASILTAMENAGADEVTEDVERKGLGTTATRAAILENIISKGYVERSKKNLIPTERAYKLMEVVPDELKSPTMTAEMENTLSLVAKGQASADNFIQDMIEYMTKIVNEYRNKTVDNNPFGSQESANILGNCPKCNQAVKKGKWGAWCSGKCGMNVSKVFGHQLTDKQVSSLLNGKSVTYKNGQYTNTVLPEIEPFSYKKDGKEVKGFQWKTKGKK